MGDLQRFGDQRTIDLMQQLQKTIGESAMAKVGLESAGDKIQAESGLWLGEFG
jgi:hypothetical protein